ncbi:MAG: NUDIX domain-containing protein [Erysipelotrichaceae bacterium]|nr:NUDIX domain-containing protein [Erysipelotrichaceae bacterium]
MNICGMTEAALYTQGKENGMTEETSCGAVLYKKETDIRYLIIRDRNDNYGFPKGHIEEGESLRETALREIKEETGTDALLDDDFCFSFSYPIKGDTVIKTVHYFLGTFTGEPFINDGEAKEILLLEYEEAYDLLTFTQSKELLKEAHGYLLRSIGQD